MTATARAAAAAERLSGTTLDICHVRELQRQLARLQALAILTCAHYIFSYPALSARYHARSLTCAQEKNKKTDLFYLRLLFCEALRRLRKVSNKTFKTHFKLILNKSFHALIFCPRNLSSKPRFSAG